MTTIVSLLVVSLCAKGCRYISSWKLFSDVNKRQPCGLFFITQSGTSTYDIKVPPEIFSLQIFEYEIPKLEQDKQASQDDTSKTSSILISNRCLFFEDSEIPSLWCHVSWCVSSALDMTLCISLPILSFLKVALNSRINITIQELDMDSSHKCSQGHVSFHDIFTRDKILIRRVCGRLRMFNVYSKTNVVQIYYESQNFHQAKIRGFYQMMNEGRIQYVTATQHLITRGGLEQTYHASILPIVNFIIDGIINVFNYRIVGMFGTRLHLGVDGNSSEIIKLFDGPGALCSIIHLERRNNSSFGESESFQVTVVVPTLFANHDFMVSYECDIFT